MNKFTDTPASPGDLLGGYGGSRFAALRGFSDKSQKVEIGMNGFNRVIRTTADGSEVVDEVPQDAAQREEAMRINGEAAKVLGGDRDAIPSIKELDPKFVDLVTKKVSDTDKLATNEVVKDADFLKNITDVTDPNTKGGKAPMAVASAQSPFGPPAAATPAAKGEPGPETKSAPAMA